MTWIAVLTGDLAGSTKAEHASVEATFRRLSDCAQSIARWQGTGQESNTKFTRYRGDGWQMVLRDPTLALRAALTVFTTLRAVKPGLTTRIGIGIGQYRHLGSTTLDDASGEAFEAAGRLLDEMKPRLFGIEGSGATAEDQIIVELLEVLARRWTPHQAEALAAWLHPDGPTLNILAKRFSITPQAVNYRLKGVDGSALRHALNAWEDAKEIQFSAGVAVHV